MSPPLGWKTGTAPWRAALCPELGAAASRGVTQQGFPVSPVRDWIRRSRSCTCRGLVMYLPYTCAGDAPDHEAAMSALVTAVSEVPGRLAQIRREASEAFHGLYVYVATGPGLDRGGGEWSV